MIRLPPFVCLCLLLSSLLTMTAAPAWPLKLHSSGRYLVDQNNTPVWLKGEAPWQGFSSISTNHWIEYLDAKSTQGVTCVMVQLIDNKYQDSSTNAAAIVPPANFYGEIPFSDTNDWTTVQQDYYDRGKTQVLIALERGFTVFLFPHYYGINAASGWQSCITANTSNAMYWHGRFLGTNYAAYSNLVWCAGGDADPGTSTLRHMTSNQMYGLSTYDTDALMTGHSSGSTGATGNRSKGKWTTENWVNINGVYATGKSNVWSAVQNAYTANTTNPAFFFEGIYENEGVTRQGLRAQHWWTITSGGCGHFFGNDQTWKFGTTWASSLNTAGSRDNAVAYQWIDRVPWYDLVPDTANTIQTNDLPTASARITTARVSDGTAVYSYFPTNGTAKIVMTNLVGPSVLATWYDTTNAVETYIGTYANTGAQEFTQADGRDMLLQLLSTNTATLAKRHVQFARPFGF